ncbi:hypothetical protein [Tautonia sociabilis]|uniref:DUF1795 domain-containing protein n=1 Tax=Tautonia sociabilis TaxID=2080755 RepID=A0A432MLH1_9BACT|nr:hypothetical protein [Tautonia sociabilis]RUL88109.1 hypothetical protein TsocGM_09230 [Tautonia sociabilis]
MGTALPMFIALTALATASQADPVEESPPRFSSEKYGLSCPLADGWEVVLAERDDLIFVAKIPQRDPDRPGAVGCELGLAPESLDEYRTRIAANAERGRIPGELVRNELVDAGDGPRLVTVTEFRPPFGGSWREVTVRRIAHRQMYAFTLNADADDPGFDAALDAFDALVDGASFSPPDTGARPADPGADRNRWVQDEFQFAVDLPDGWAPVLAPSQLALLFANGPAHGIWSDNFLVIARPARGFDPDRLAIDLPDLLRNEEPGCEVLSCEVIDQPGAGKAVETVARTQRGPFSMTVLERRFRGDRFEYEAKFTLESERFDALAPALRRCLDSFAEVPGEVSGAPAGVSG